MSENCTHDCSSCTSNCAERKADPKSFLKPLNKYSKIQNVIGVISGKGGVGKSFVTCALACGCAAAGFKVGILDADVTGPSVPRSFGITARAMQNETGLLPAESKTGIKIMSVNLLLESENTPVVWRGPVISGVIEQFWTDVNWGELDYLFVDMPPGTGDVALTVFQSLPVTGAVIVDTPQSLVKMIVEKALNMANMMHIPVLGIIENMSTFICDQCGKRHDIFGESHTGEIAEAFQIPLLAQIPLRAEVRRLVDEGKIEDVQVGELSDFLAALCEK